jgi:hypothetical protein
MAIPHATAAYPELAKAVQLPVRKTLSAQSSADGGERRRRRTRG